MGEIMENFAAIILAAGKGTRMKSEKCKVLHPVAGRPMILYTLDAVQSCKPHKVVIIIGHQGEHVKDALSHYEFEFALQEPQLGTGHAVQSSQTLFQNYSGDVLILCGDTPLITRDSLSKFLDFHKQNESKLSVLTGIASNPYGYGRIVRNASGQVLGIVEERDASEYQKTIHEVNTGIYLVNSELLFQLLGRIKANNSQQEYYLTDIVSEAIKDEITVFANILEDFSEASGINTRLELANASKQIWEKKRIELMAGGVSLLDPESVFCDFTVEIGSDTTLFPSVHLTGNTHIGRNCTIESGVHIINSRLADGVTVLQGSRLDNVIIAENASIGPMAHLRPETVIGQNARIGNFVEVKKSSIGNGTKASHLTYLGDSTIGNNVNIGCGTITCNYDGKKKHTTIIGDNCFVGSDVQLVAPVEIGDGSVIGAGSTITKNVPPKSLAISRSRQKIYPLRKGQGSVSQHEDRES
jgi:bifunctional UDP-N-acetylglucosamine pyrophosphorylase / glucosamine-1-phosphate N-acetyltransferase